MPNLPTQLARRWCSEARHNRKGVGCDCPRIAAAVREALKEAEKLVASRGCTKVACGPSGHAYAGCPQNMAAGLAALRGEV